MSDRSRGRGHGELADTLRALRLDARMSGAAAAKAAGRSQAWISRFENGKIVPRPADVEVLTDVYRTPARVRRHLLRLSQALHEDATPRARVVMDRGAGRMQRRIGEIEGSSTLIRTFQPAVVPGLLQTEAYARAVFASGATMPPAQQADALAERMHRQDLLRRPGRREFVLLMSEGALRWQLGGPLVMAEQLDRIAASSRLPGVRVGVVPWTVEVSVAPVNGFDLLDERAAIVGTETATAFLTDPGDAAAYVSLFGQIEAVAVFDEAAGEVLDALAVAYRSLS